MIRRLLKAGTGSFLMFVSAAMPPHIHLIGVEETTFVWYARRALFAFGAVLTLDALRPSR